ncbi:MAG: hypothetical protein AAGA09_04495 [Pseudomonadota bacterium]
MKISSRLVSTLLVSTALSVVAACSDADISSPGEGDFIPPTDGGSGGDGNGGGDNPAPSADLTPTAGCPAGTSAQTIPNTTVQACEVAVDANGAITQDLTLIADRQTVYFFSQPTFVGVDDGPTPGALGGATVDLTIEAGANLVFLNPTDFLTVNRGSRIIANGTAAAPIVFTSDEDMLDNLAADDSQGAARGQWGGLILNGRAPINSCADPSTPATCETSGEGGTGNYGGDNPADDSGVLNYVRVQYAGFEITTDNELNGIAFQGVGNGTEVDYVQVHNNDDDGVEFFGGTVDVRHLVITGVDDDAMDWVAGWTGSAQDILVIGSGVGDNGFEGDSNSSNNDISPRSNPLVSNFTLIGGPSEDLGMQLRVGTAGLFVNGIVAGWEDGCLDIDDAATHALIADGADVASNGVNDEDLQISSVFFGCDTPFDDLDNDPGDITTAFSGITTGSSTLSGPLPGANEAAITAVDPSTFDSRFAAETFAGAFEPGLEPSETWAFGWTVPGSVFPAAGCPTGTTDITSTATVTPPSGGNVCRIETPVVADTTLTIGNIYNLAGTVFVGEDVGPDADNPTAGAATAELTIQAGVTVYGADPTDFLVVNRGSKINALGTSSAPIVFTSDEDVNGANTGDERGQWGGLILNGRAPINSCADPSTPATCETSGEGGTGNYGGNKVDDNSGILNFVRVQHAGFEITTDNELNGIAFQGVGNGTEVDYVQVHANDDDGVEFFGGTVDVSHLVITGVDDDAMDWVAGWTGSAQYILIVGSGVGDNGFEGDSNSSNNDISPRSNPIVSNFTLVGGATEDLGMQIRVGTAGLFVNGVVTGWEDGCLDIDDAATLALIEPAPADVASDGVNDEDLQIDATYFSCATPFDDTDNDGAVDITTAFGAGITTGASTLVTGGGSSTAILNGANENAVTPVDPTTLDSTLEAVTQIGAVGTAGDNWFAGWTKPGSF